MGLQLALIYSLVLGSIQPAVEVANDLTLVRQPVFRRVPKSMISFLKKEFDLYKGSFTDIVYVARRVKPEISPIVLGLILLRESYGGDPLAVRYCSKWGKHKSGKRKGKPKCVEEFSCSDCWGKGHKNKKTGKFYSASYLRKNGLDLGRWQLRHNPHGWSWLRYYGRVTGQKVTIDCAFDTECARRAMVEAINYLDETRPRTCRRPSYRDAYQWIGGWNTCKAYRGHVDNLAKYEKKYQNKVRGKKK